MSQELQYKVAERVATWKQTCYQKVEPELDAY